MGPPHRKRDPNPPETEKRRECSAADTPNKDGPEEVSQIQKWEQGLHEQVRDLNEMCREKNNPHPVVVVIVP